MIALQFAYGPELWFVLLLFAISATVILVAAVALVNRASGSDADADTDADEIEELKRRVERLEAEREQQ